MSRFVVNWRIQSWFTTQWAKTTPKRNTNFFQQAKNESFGHSELLFRIWGMMAGYVWVRFFVLNKTCSVNWSGKMILHLQRWAISANRNTFLLNNNSKQPNLSSCNPHRKVFQTSRPRCLTAHILTELPEALEHEPTWPPGSSSG